MVLATIDDAQVVLAEARVVTTAAQLVDSLTEFPVRLMRVADLAQEYKGTPVIDRDDSSTVHFDSFDRAKAFIRQAIDKYNIKFNASGSTVFVW